MLDKPKYQVWSLARRVFESALIPTSIMKSEVSVQLYTTRSNHANYLLVLFSLTL